MLCTNCNHHANQHQMVVHQADTWCLVDTCGCKVFSPESLIVDGYSIFEQYEIGLRNDISHYSAVLSNFENAIHAIKQAALTVAQITGMEGTNESLSEQLNYLVADRESVKNKRYKLMEIIEHLTEFKKMIYEHNE